MPTTTGPVAYAITTIYTPHNGPAAPHYVSGWGSIVIVTGNPFGMANHPNAPTPGGTHGHALTYPTRAAAQRAIAAAARRWGHTGYSVVPAPVGCAVPNPNTAPHPMAGAWAAFYAARAGAPSAYTAANQTHQN